MARNTCGRCGVVSQHDQAHLCKDVGQRFDEAVRRAAVSCQGTGSLDGWLKRMEHYAPKGRPPVVHEWSVDHSGHMNDVCPSHVRSS